MSVITYCLLAWLIVEIYFFRCECCIAHAKILSSVSDIDRSCWLIGIDNGNIINTGHSPTYVRTNYEDFGLTLADITGRFRKGHDPALMQYVLDHGYIRAASFGMARVSFQHRELDEVWVAHIVRKFLIEEAFSDTARVLIENIHGHTWEGSVADLIARE